MKNKFLIKSHSIKGFGGFYSETNINFSSNGPTVIIGINGSGKTSILESLYYTLSYIVAPLSNTGNDYFSLNASKISLRETESIITTTFEIKEQTGLIDFGETKILYKLFMDNSTVYHGTSIDYLKNHLKSNVVNGVLPVFRYFQALKIFDESEKRLSLNSVERRTIGYQSNSDTNIQIQNITNFILNQINIENSERIEKKDFQFETTNGRYIRNTLNLFTSILYNEAVTVSAKASKYSTHQSLTFLKNKEEIEFIQLSRGEKYVFSIVLELIYRIVTLNGNQSNLVNTTGIILIDEIESHLHPKWQISILDALQSCFPNIQFIVSTHSSLIASTIKRNQIVALNNFEIIPSNQLPNIYGGTSDELLEKILFTDNRINTFDTLKNKIDILINKREFEKAEVEFLLLKEKLQGSNPQWVKDLDNKIRFSKL